MYCIVHSYKNTSHSARPVGIPVPLFVRPRPPLLVPVCSMRASPLVRTPTSIVCALSACVRVCAYSLISRLVLIPHTTRCPYCSAVNTSQACHLCLLYSGKPPSRGCDRSITQRVWSHGTTVYHASSGEANLIWSLFADEAVLAESVNSRSAAASVRGPDEVRAQTKCYRHANHLIV